MALGPRPTALKVGRQATSPGVYLRGRELVLKGWVKDAAGSPLATNGHIVDVSGDQLHVMVWPATPAGEQLFVTDPDTGLQYEVMRMAYLGRSEVDVLTVDFRGAAGSTFMNLTGSLPMRYEGNDGAEFVLGGGGNDTINTAGGDDTVGGGQGNDSITLGPGADLTLLGLGQDTVSADGADIVLDADKGDTVRRDAT